ncbi:Hypothetical protein SMAX5B_008503 [Scophthalmus maximus]|uniref:Uncharacterized protein n=1 Tax=Scophthalmus maximus TaxID=52904 RepID=A0A2U9CEB9_SCOMX|nr:Hypothetical protein SMAX5B_008503 [Scophthalmus maximus]
MAANLPVIVAEMERFVPPLVVSPEKTPGTERPRTDVRPGNVASHRSTRLPISFSGSQRAAYFPNPPGRRILTYPGNGH